MSDGYGYNSRSRGRPAGHDIGPDEQRLYTEGTPVEMITTRRNSHGEIEYITQTVYVTRPPNGIFIEPVDESTSVPGFAHTESELLRAEDKRFYIEANRLQTYDAKWLDDYHVRPSDLARDGFIHIGPGDKVKCVFCLKTLRHWEHNDSVESEHRKHYPDCPFVQGKCEHLNVPLNQSEDYKRSLGVKVKTGQQETSMQDFSHRLNTYKMWPRHAHIRPDALAEAGLFCLGRDDYVQCFSCGTVFAKWQPGDDPWFEHARWSPDCAFLHSVKGTGYVQGVQEQTKNDKNTEAEMKESEESEEMNQHVGGQATALSHPVQVMSAQIDKDLKIPFVQAAMEVFNVSVEDMRHKLEKIRIGRGTDYEITHADLADMEK